jgi:uncharacterized membrane protein (DUF373 family)
MTRANNRTEGPRAESQQGAVERVENSIRDFACQQLRIAEIVIYTLLAIMLSLTAILVLVSAGGLIWEILSHWSNREQAIEIVERLLFVLMVLEILHTVRISIQHHRLEIEPFLVVGIIASIRRILVITLEGSNLAKPEIWSPRVQSLFNESLWEMALLAGVILVLVVAIMMVRHITATTGDPPATDSPEGETPGSPQSHEAGR